MTAPTPAQRLRAAAERVVAAEASYGPLALFGSPVDSEVSALAPALAAAVLAYDDAFAAILTIKGLTGKVYFRELVRIGEAGDADLATAAALLPDGDSDGGA